MMPGALSNFFRRPHGPSLALVGDAGYHKDPILVLGMSDAFLDAEYLAEAVVRDFLMRWMWRPPLPNTSTGELI